MLNLVKCFLIIFLQIMIALNDPLRKDGMIKMLLGDVLTIEDEHGNKHELVSLGGLYIDANNFRMPGLPFRIMKTVALRDDDIFLLTYPKTGSIRYSLLIFSDLDRENLQNIRLGLICDMVFGLFKPCILSLYSKFQKNKK